MAQRLNRMMTRRSLVAGAAGTLLATAVVGLPASTSGQIYPGTSVKGIDISGLSPAAGEALLRTTFAGLEAHAVTYTYEGRSWRASLADLGMAIDYEAMIERAMEHGRDGGLVDRYTALLDERVGNEVPLVLVRDNVKLRRWLGAIGEVIAVEPRDARLRLVDKEIVLAEHAAGRKLDIERAIADTVREVCTAEPATIELATMPVEPAVTTASLEGARTRAERLVSEPVFLTLGDDTFPIDTETLMPALSLDGGDGPALDVAALAPRIDQIAAAVAVSPRNVMLGWDGGLYVVDDDVEGRAVDRARLEDTVIELAAKTDRAAPLPVRPVPAAARTDNFDQLGIDGHLAYGASSFAGSSEARAANVAVSARNISYKLVAPGEAFSFNELLGPITEKNGFVSGTIIQGNWEASDIGGGVCQVSTTVFRAAAFAGFEFLEWHPHSWRLGFYEADGSPPGLDGAIYQPNTPYEIEKDLVFRNPLDSWLLLMMVVDGDTVYAHLYGRDNGWTVEMGEPRLGEPKPIPEPESRVNPNLAPGERIKVQNARAGVTVRMRRTVTAADGTTVSDGDFVSDYRSVPEAWEVGPR